MSGRRATFDRAEFLRFVATGLTAAAANLATVYAVRQVAPLSVGIPFGIAAGFLVSFLLAKYFAFDAARSGRSGAELARFALVFAVGCICYWLVAVLGSEALRPLLGQARAEVLATLAGAFLMMLTSYFGHRFVTFRPPAGKGRRD